MASPKGKEQDPEDVDGSEVAPDTEDLDAGEPDDETFEDVLEDDNEIGIAPTEPFDDDEDDEDSSPRARKVKSDDEDDDDVEPEDLEADLDTILRDRMATLEDEDEEPDEDTNVVVSNGVKPVEVVTCGSCFLGVNTSQLHKKDYCPHCGDQLVSA